MAENSTVCLEKVLEQDVIKKYIDLKVSGENVLEDISFKNTDTFNFAFDVIDVLGKKCPDDIAMLHIDANSQERHFTFGKLMELSGRAANYFVNLGIKKGDKVMLVLKRHYQFWVSILALHKIGAIAIPATNQLQVGDFEYRFKATDISAILCTVDGNVAKKAEEAEKTVGISLKKIIVNGEIDGWHSFDSEYTKYTDCFERTENSPCGEDTMFMFFTSGTTGYPKIVAHNYKYPLGHYVTAKYWHKTKCGKIHFTVSETGWGKTFWGKLYGQWLCGSIVFVYDFDRFSAEDILPLFKKYNITTFCAPPTVYRMLIKVSPEKYDLSSLEHVTTAGEPLNHEVFERFKELTGFSIMEGFGQTETTLIIGNLNGMEPKPGSMGKPIPAYNIGLINSENKECAADEVGEIVIYKENSEMCGIIKRYYSQVENLNDVWQNGIYRTGDLAKRDADGYYWYVGRADDIIKSSGYKIGPFEVENTIMELPYVLECAVSGEPDEIRGQIVKANIILVSGTEPTEELKKEIQNYVKANTAPYKYPRKVVFVDELPKTISGKVIRKKL